jgi:hypothetical protein
MNNQASLEKLMILPQMGVYTKDNRNWTLILFRPDLIYQLFFSHEV